MQEVFIFEKFITYKKLEVCSTQIQPIIDLLFNFSK